MSAVVFVFHLTNEDSDFESESDIIFFYKSLTLYVQNKWKTSLKSKIPEILSVLRP